MTLAALPSTSALIAGVPDPAGRAAVAVVVILAAVPEEEEEEEEEEG